MTASRCPSEVRGIADAANVWKFSKRHIAYESDPEGFRVRWQPKEDELSAHCGSTADCGR
ncbi:MAG: hypothetical protein U0694_13805 [Anaerolineae bacterium]